MGKNFTFKKKKKKKMFFVFSTLGLNCVFVSLQYTRASQALSHRPKALTGQTAPSDTGAAPL